jgi:hypothetical protein
MQTPLMNLYEMIRQLQPELDPAEYVFATFADPATVDAAALEALCSFREKEGLSLILEAGTAGRHGLQASPRFRRITLTVLSSLESVGLTAAVAGCLADKGISANVVAASHHDHVFVPASRAEEAMAALRELSTGKYQRH